MSPLYTYACKTCKLLFHRPRKLVEESSMYPCPVCDTGSDKIFMPPNFVVKGGADKVKGYSNSKPSGYKDYRDEEEEEL